MTRLRLSANLGFLWAELPLLERIKQAAGAGFKAIELHWPYDTAATDVREVCQAHGLTLLSINTPQGDTAQGDAGLAAQVGREKAFQAAFMETLAWAQASGASMIHVLPGMANKSDPVAARQTFIHNLQWAADQAAPAGMTLLLEALNPRDKPGYFYHSVLAADGIRQACARENIKLMFDVYHVGVTEGDILTKLRQLMPMMGHIQIAAVPSRAEPDEGEVRYEAIFQALRALDYQGFVGLEYKPRGDVSAGLAWVERMGLSLG
jgi:hydroxypyruvate isomerase